MEVAISSCIFLWQPDPLNEALECIVGGNGCIGGENDLQTDSEVRFVMFDIIMPHCGAILRMENF